MPKVHKGTVRNVSICGQYGPNRDKQKNNIKAISRMLCQNGFFGSRRGSVHVDVEKQDIVIRKGLKDVDCGSYK